MYIYIYVLYIKAYTHTQHLIGNTSSKMMFIIMKLAWCFSTAPSHLFRSPPPTAWSHLSSRPRLLHQVVLPATSRALISYWSRLLWLLP